MTSPEWDVSTDVLVVGAGGAGLVAALSACEFDIRVTLLEKQSEVGGTTAMSGGSIVGADTEAQREAGIEDSPEAFATDICDHGDEGTDRALARTLAEESRETIAWLEKTLGVSLRVNDGPYGRHGHRVHRRHWLVGEDGEIERSGQALVNALVREAHDSGVEILTNHPVTAIVFDDEAALGVEAGEHRTEHIRAKKILLATGGFAGSPEMRRRLIPGSESLVYWGDEGSTGDGIRFGVQGDAAVENMEAFLGFPTIARPEGVFVPWEVSKEGAFVVDSGGNRLGDAGACAYSEFAAKLHNCPEQTTYLVFDQRVYDAMAAQPSTMNRWEKCLSYDVFDSAPTVEELASIASIDSDVLAETVTAITAVSSDDEQAVDGYTRTVRRPLRPPFYVTEIEPAILQTQGGLAIDNCGRVLNTAGDPIPNLYAGGGAAVSVSGSQPEGYLSGNGLLTALNLGRIMGRDAAQMILQSNSET